MSNTNTGGPAFPTTKPLESWGDPNQGMTLRDYFAAKATGEDIKNYMQDDGNLISGTDTLGRPWERREIIYFTREQAKYRYADAMLKARDQ
jgi:hypothetical protein